MSFVYRISAAKASISQGAHANYLRVWLGCLAAYAVSCAFLGPRAADTPIAAGMGVGGAGPNMVRWFMGSHFLGFAATAIWAILAKQKPWLGSNPVILTTSFLGLWVAGLGVEPTLDDDLFRYMWDGFVTTQGLEPILHRPSEGALGFPSGLIAKIGYPDAPTIYPPGAQWLFGLFWSWFGSRVVLWTLGFAGITFLTVCLLLKVADRVGAPAPLKIWLCLSPLVIKEFGDSSHVDIAGLLLLAWALAYWLKLADSHRQSLVRTSCIGVLLGMGGLVKVYPLFAVAFWPRASVLQRFVAGGVAGFVFAAGVLIYSKGFENLGYYLSSLSYFKNQWVFFPGWADLVHFILERSSSHDEIWPLAIGLSNASAGLWLLILSCCSLIMREVPPLLGVVAMGGFIIMQPVVNHWYLIWLWPWLLLLPSSRWVLGLPWLCLPLVTVLGYVYWSDLEDESLLRQLAWGVWFSTFCGLPLMFALHKIPNDRPTVRDKI